MFLLSKNVRHVVIFVNKDENLNIWVFLRENDNCLISYLHGWQFLLTMQLNYLVEHRK